MANPLVIVESPAKAKTIAGFLASANGVRTAPGWRPRPDLASATVDASVGHVRDLPRNAADVPEAEKRQWEILGIDVENDFKPLYVVSRDKKDVIKKLKAELKNASELYLATDEDREGEAIAWHLLEVLNPPASMPVKRMVFHEITPQAIQAAIENPRDIDRRLVDAQEARRLLDRIYGYGPLASVARQKVGPGSTVGRVQSVGTRLVVERERERMRFVSASYWDLDGEFSTVGVGRGRSRPHLRAPPWWPSTAPAWPAARTSARTARSAAAWPCSTRLGPTAVAGELVDAAFSVRSVERRPYRRRPSPPFITSTFQQEAGRKLRLSSSMAMRAAQSLYEAGYITYMRTDSTTLSDTALSAARSEIAERYGRQFLPDAPRHYAKKVKNAQEAHEAIRPAGDTFRSPEQVAGGGEPHRGPGLRAHLEAHHRLADDRRHRRDGDRATGCDQPGGAGRCAGRGPVARRRVLHQRHDHHPPGLPPGLRGGPRRGRRRRRAGAPAPTAGRGRRRRRGAVEPHGHETQPPARYTEASLVKRLEELGVGRPSTYASTIKTIQDREYVWKKGTALVPSFKAFAVVNLLEQHFPDLVDYSFTARMEDDLDEIAGGTEELVPWLSEFYFGAADANGQRAGGLKEMVGNRIGEIDAAAVNAIPIGVDPDGVPIVAKPGRDNSPYLIRGDDTASIPANLAPDELTVDKALELLAAPKGGRELGQDPVSGLTVYAKSGRFGPYVQLGEYDDEGKTKPKMASLFSTMTLDHIDLAEALELLSLPRVVGVDPTDGAEITAQNGRYGPYISKALADGKTDSRSLANEEQLLTVGVDEAVALFAQPKTRRGQAVKPPLRQLGLDTISGKPMVIKDGRFGPYVTDGETNASLRKADDVETITDERASELLADRRDRGPAPKKAAKKSTAKKSTARSRRPRSRRPRSRRRRR